MMTINTKSQKYLKTVPLNCNRILKFSSVFLIFYQIKPNTVDRVQDLKGGVPHLSQPVALQGDSPVSRKTLRIFRAAGTRQAALGPLRCGVGIQGRQ